MSESFRESFRAGVNGLLKRPLRTAFGVTGIVAVCNLIAPLATTIRQVGDAAKEVGRTSTSLRLGLEDAKRNINAVFSTPPEQAGALSRRTVDGFMHGFAHHAGTSEAHARSETLSGLASEGMTSDLIDPMFGLEVPSEGVDPVFGLEIN